MPRVCRSRHALFWGRGEGADSRAKKSCERALSSQKPRLPSCDGGTLLFVRPSQKRVPARMFIQNSPSFPGLLSQPDCLDLCCPKSYSYYVTQRQVRGVTAIGLCFCTASAAANSAGSSKKYDQRYASVVPGLFKGCARCGQREFVHRAVVPPILAPQKPES